MDRWLVALAICSGCSDQPTLATEVGASDASSTTDTSPASDAIEDGGVSSISGNAAGMPFDTAATALWAGAPDDPATTVVYVFSKPTDCSALVMPGWDTRITDKTQFLEMKAFGVTPAAYTVTPSKTPAPGEASVNYTLSNKTSTPAEIGGTGGTVTLSAVNAKASVTGTFSLKFGTDSLSGSFDAKYCPGGSEP